MELKLSTLEFGEEREHRKAIIAAVDDTFTDVGRRLGIIHDKKLYREHGSFEEYCLKFFKISKVHAYRLMEIAGVRAGITKKSNTRVTSNRALTALAAVPEADRDAVVTEAAKSGPVTAPAIKAAAEKIATPPKAREEKPAEPVKRYDKVGQVIPDGILAEWDRATEIAAGMMKAASDNKCLVENGLVDGDNIFAELSNSTVALLKNFHTDAKLVKPHAVCSTCKGIKPKTCTTCKKRGWLSDFYWSTKVPSDLRAMIEKQGKK